MKTPPSTIKRFVAYYRVSHQRQGRSGLGLEAQRVEIARYLAGIPHELVEFTEIESGRRTDRHRPQLREALALCKRAKAVLIVARLDRLARNVAFLSALLETDVQVIFADMPTADRFQLHVMAAVAEYTRHRISLDTKAALARAKARGTVLGTPQNLAQWLPIRIAHADAHAERLRPTLEAFVLAGYTQRTMVEQLNALGLLPPAGKAGRSWSLVQLQRVLTRLRKPPAKAAPKRRLRLAA